MKREPSSSQHRRFKCLLVCPTFEHVTNAVADVGTVVSQLGGDDGGIKDCAEAFDSHMVFGDRGAEAQVFVHGHSSPSAESLQGQAGE